MSDNNSEGKTGKKVFLSGNVTASGATVTGVMMDTDAGDTTVASTGLPDDKMARKLMFASFIYLPIIQFLYVFNHI